MTNQILLILGMHRSGTSLVSNWIHHCGINLGDRLLNASPSNKNGHFEDRDFLDVHIQLLEENGFDTDGLLDIGDIQINDYFNKRLESLVSFKKGMRNQWGWKEPRSCLFINQYEKIVDNPSYLILYRPADEVVDSLLRRKYAEVIATKMKSGWREVFKVKLFKNKIKVDLYKQYKERFFKSWILYNQSLLTFMKNDEKNNFIAVSYKDLIEQDENVLDWLTKRGYEIERKRFDSFYDPKLMKQKAINFEIGKKLRSEVDSINSGFSKFILY